MTNKIPHVTLSASSISGTLLSYLAYVSHVAPSVETWLVSVGIPAAVGIISWFNQEFVNGRKPSLADIPSLIVTLEQAKVPAEQALAAIKKSLAIA